MNTCLRNGMDAPPCADGDGRLVLSVIGCKRGAPASCATPSLLRYPRPYGSLGSSSGSFSLRLRRSIHPALQRIYHWREHLLRAFIVRPFGVKSDVDFDDVERLLIGPVLDRLGITGRTTGDIVSQGNIREDMFRLLLTADLVIADLSIHNANVFYELGMRHALRDKS